MMLLSFCTIQNCVVTMLRTNIYSMGINVDNRQATSTTQATVTLDGDRNIGWKVYGNTIQNVYSCIYFRGYSTVTAGLVDSLNDFGGTSAATGNQLLSWGGTVVGYGLYVYNQKNLNISYNNIDNYNGGLQGGLAAASGATLYGIYNYNGPTTFMSQNLTENYNTIKNTVATGSSATAYGIYNYYYAGKRTITFNDVKVVTQGATVCTGSYYFFYDYAPLTGATVGQDYTFTDNTISTLTLNNSTGTLGFLLYVWSGWLC